MRDGLRRLAAGLPVQESPMPASGSGSVRGAGGATEPGLVHLEQEEPQPPGVPHHRGRRAGGRLLVVGLAAALVAVVGAAATVRAQSSDRKVNTVTAEIDGNRASVSFAELDGTRWLVEAYTDRTDRQVRDVSASQQQRLALDVLHGFVVGDSNDPAYQAPCDQFVYDERTQEMGVAPCRSGPPDPTAVPVLDEERGQAVTAVRQILPGAAVTRDGDRITVAGPGGELRSRLAGTAQPRTVDWGLLVGSRWTVVRSGTGPTADTPAPERDVAWFEISAPTLPAGIRPFGTARGRWQCVPWTVTGARYDDVGGGAAIDCAEPVTDPAGGLIGPVLAASPFAVLDVAGLRVTGDAGTIEAVPAVLARQDSVPVGIEADDAAPAQDTGSAEPRVTGDGEAATRCRSYAVTVGGSAIAARLATAGEVRTWSDSNIQSLQQAVQAIGADPTGTVAVCVLHIATGFPAPGDPPGGDTRPYLYARCLVHPDGGGECNGFGKDALDTEISPHGPWSLHAPSVEELDGRSFSLVAIELHGTDVPPADAGGATIAFDAGSHAVSGSIACNAYTGSYRAGDGGGVVLSNGSTTLIGCGEVQERLAGAIMRLLSNGQADVLLDDERLLIRDEHARLIFQAG